MVNLYNTKWIGFGYDLLASLIWFPSKKKLYRKCVSLINIEKGDSVLELACGTGYLTLQLLNKQADVISVDQSVGMLAKAKQRVPFGKFVHSDMFKYTNSKKFDYVVFFFVLHELTASERIRILKLAKGFLNKNGKIIICDFSIPNEGIMKTIFPKLIRLWESHEVSEFLKNALSDEIRHTNLTVTCQKKLHNGMVQLIEVKESTL